MIFITESYQKDDSFPNLTLVFQSVGACGRTGRTLWAHWAHVGAYGRMWAHFSGSLKKHPKLIDFRSWPAKNYYMHVWSRKKLLENGLGFVFKPRGHGMFLVVSDSTS